MFRNYLTVALRTLTKQKAYTFINISGLAVGMACCLLIVLYIQDEARYDRFHERADELYRVRMDLKVPGAEYPLASTMPTLAPTLVSDIPEVEQAVRISRQTEHLVAHDETRFYEEGFFFADSTLFDVFTYPLLRGNPETALATPFSVVLTEAAARKYFGEEDPMGQVLTLENTHDFTVTGVLAPVPRHSHFQFDFLASFQSQEGMGVTNLEEWSSISSVHTYVIVPENHTPGSVERKLPGLIETYAADLAEAVTFHLEPVTEIHLYADLANELEDAGGSITTLYVFASIALLILLIASINFINLSTARSVNRAREVGMRKVLGAYRLQLIKQFLGESVLLAVLSLVTSLLLVQALLPIFNGLMDTSLSVNYFQNGLFLLALAGVTLFVGLIAGTYPAFVLSAFRPVEVLKGQAKRGIRASFFRQVLVVGQFAIAIVLIIGAIIMSSQMSFFVEQDVGFDEEQVVVVPLRDQAIREQYETFKGALVRNSNVLGAAAASNTPGSNSYSLSSFIPEGAVDEEEELSIATVFVDHDLIETLGLEMVAGRGFSADVPTDTAGALVINEAAVAFFGWDDAVGKTLREDDREARVIGVVEDFHFSSLQEEILPLALRFVPETFQFLTVRIRPQNVTETLAFLGQTWQSFAPAYPFEYYFMDEDFADKYASVQQLSRTIRSFAILAIFVACLGLFGLVSYTTQQRTKEIGVRKVLGASVPGILLLLSKDFLKLVAVAFVVAAPLAYLAMSQWLEDFAYRIEIGVGTFVFAGGLALLIAFLTVSYQSVKAARADPVRSLRYE